MPTPLPNPSLPYSRLDRIQFRLMRILIRMLHKNAPPGVATIIIIADYKRNDLNVYHDVPPEYALQAIQGAEHGLRREMVEAGLAAKQEAQHDPL